MENEESGRFKALWTSEDFVIGLVALASVVLHLFALRGYGYFRDELYYIACSDHLAFGYVDQPPFSIFLLKGIRLIFGDSLVAIRMLPVLGGAMVIFMTGKLAKELGGRGFGVILAAIAAFAPIGNLFEFNYYSMNFLDHLFWLSCFFLLVRIIKTENPKIWILFGIIAGLGLQNKISILFLLFGMGVGLLFTSQRRQLKYWQFWAGMGITLLLFLPYVIWNAVHGWPTLEFIHNAREYKMSAVSPVGFFIGQLLHQNPATLIVWLAGLGYFFFHREARPYRLFGWLFLSVYVLFTVQEAKAYYLAGGYPILFAGGAILIGHLLERPRLRWLKPVLMAFLLIPTLVLCPMALPVFSTEKMIVYLESVGIQSDSGERHEMGVLPQHYADMHGWEEMAATVAEVYGRLSPEEQSKCFIFLRNYGEAGAIDFFGKAYGLPPAVCGHNNYWLWGPGDPSANVGIIIGDSHDVQESFEDLQSHFEEVVFGATFECRYCMPYEDNLHFFICRGMRSFLEEIWPGQKHFN